MELDTVFAWSCERRKAEEMTKQFFPWRLFSKLFMSLVLIMNGFGWGSLLWAAHFFKFPFFQLKIFYFLIGLFLISLLLAWFFAYRFALPLRRVILKAFRMANKRLFFQIMGQESEGDIDQESLFESEPGEYFELEQSLDKIRKKMKKRRSQLAHKQEESQAIMTSIEDGVVNVTPDLRLLYFNSGFAAHFLMENQISGEHVKSVMLTQVIRDLPTLDLFEAAIRDGHGGHIQRQMSTLIMGGLRHFSITINPLRDLKTKEVYAVLGVFHDITELKRSEQIRIEFVQNASHELRTPLTTVKGYLGVFREDFDAGRIDQASFFLDTISKNVDRLNELVSDLLTISSLENGETPRLENVPLDRVSSDVIERFSKLAGAKGMTVSYQIEGLVRLRADLSQLERVLENLIGNAVKYGQSDGKVDVIWKNVELEHSGMWIALIVRDNGPGIPSNHLSRIFERFYRVDKARTREVGGTGLGLSIVKHILQSHGGFVSVQSEVGVGTEFACYFVHREYDAAT